VRSEQVIGEQLSGGAVDDLKSGILRVFFAFLTVNMAYKAVDGHYISSLLV